MDNQIIIAGFGGQGVLLMGQLLAYAGMLEQKNATWMPSYGPEMRGGTANCSVVLSDDEIGSPCVSEPDAAMIMNLPSLITFEPAVKSGGVLLYNTSLIETTPQRSDLSIIKVPCNAIAIELGNDRVANMVMLGAYIATAGIVSPDSVVEALRKVLGPSKEHLLPLNREALAKGASCVA